MPRQSPASHCTPNSKRNLFKSFICKFGLSVTNCTDSYFFLFQLDSLSFQICARWNSHYLEFAGHLVRKEKEKRNRWRFRTQGKGQFIGPIAVVTVCCAANISLTVSIPAKLWIQMERGKENLLCFLLFHSSAYYNYNNNTVCFMYSIHCVCVFVYEALERQHGYLRWGKSATYVCSCVYCS